MTENQDHRKSFSAHSAQQSNSPLNEELLRTIIDACGGSIYIVQNNRVVFHNPQFALLTGYTSQEIEAMDFTELVHPKDRKLIGLLFANSFREIRQKSSRSYTYRALHKNGQMLWFKSNVSLISLNGEPALLDNCFDITPQKEFEQKLVEEEQNFRLLVNGFEDMVFIISKRGVVVQVNRSVYNRLGFSEHQVVLRNFSSFFDVTQREEVKMLVPDAFFGKKVLYSGNFVKADGSLIPIETRLFKGNWSQREVVFAICQDISVRLQAEHIVKLSEEKFSKAFKTNAVMMTISTYSEGRFIDVNDTFLTATGLSRDQVIGRTSNEINLFPDINQREQLLELILSQGKVMDLETTILNSKGHQIICSFSIELIDIQGEPCLLTVLSDITDRKLAQQKILLSEQRFRQLAELLPEKVFEADSNGIITFVNNYLLSFFGFDANIIEGDFHITTLFAPRSQRVISSYLRRSRIENELPSVELMAQKADGSQFPSLTHIIAVNHNQGGVRYMGVMVDISARKQQEMELVRAKNLAVEASRAKERFLSTMSHEIRTPMNGVIGLANILLNEKPLDHQKANLQTLKHSAEGLMALLNDILDFSKIDAGKLVINRTPTSIHDLASRLYNFQSHIANRKGIGMRLELDPSIPEAVMADSVRLNQVLTNLTANAIKFTDKGEVVIAFKNVRETKATVSILFSVSDSGIGVAPEKHKLIFKEFIQAHSHTSRKYGGTGLGLPISDKLVTLMKGRIELKSQLGKGSDFFFTLTFRKVKAAKADPPSEHKSQIPLNPKGKPYRVLLVEDNEINSYIALKFLRDWGLDTTLAENGEIAIEILRTEYFDIILMDLEMPVMSGYEATKVIRALPDSTKSQIPIVALTASAMLDVQNKIFSLGMNGFILKPFNPADLKAKISELITSY